MARVQKNKRKLVRRLHSDRYMLIMLVSFAVSVSAVRFFLEISGYPQIGYAELHIGHVLWGGLFLFVGGLLPLVYANKRILDISGLLSGVGVGLFIDEVGKFITQSNDYFYPAAAPIIYVFFLLTILIWQLVRKPAQVDLRTNLFHTLEDFEEILEGDLSEIEKLKVLQRMENVDFSGDPKELQILQRTLVKYLKDLERSPVSHKSDYFERLVNKWSQIEEKLFSHKQFHVWLRSAWVIVGILLAAQVVMIFMLAGKPLLLSGIWRSIVDSTLLISNNFNFLGFVRMALQLIGGLGLCVNALFYKVGTPKKWVKSSKIILLVLLTVVNSLVFFYDQFSTLLLAGVEFLIFFLTNRFIHWKENYL